MAKFPASNPYRHALRVHVCLIALVCTPVRCRAPREVFCDDVVTLAQISVKVSSEIPKNKSAKAEPKAQLISTHTASKKDQSKSGSSLDEKSATEEGGCGELEIGALLRALPGKMYRGPGGKEYFREGDYGRIAKIAKGPAGSGSLHIVWERTGQTSAIPKAGWQTSIAIVQKPPELQVGHKVEVLQGKGYTLPNGTTVYSAGDVGKVVAVHLKGQLDKFQILWEHSGLTSVMTNDKWPNYFQFMDAWYLKRKVQPVNPMLANPGGNSEDSAHQQSLKTKKALEKAGRKPRQRGTQHPREAEEEEAADLLGTPAPSPSPRMNGDLENPIPAAEPSADELEIGPGETSTTNNVFDERELYTEHASSEDESSEEDGKRSRSGASIWRATHIGAAAIASLAVWRSVE